MDRELKYVKDGGLNCPSPEAVNTVNRREPIMFQPNEDCKETCIADDAPYPLMSTEQTIRGLRNIIRYGTFNGRSFESICCELIALHERKNKDYGGAFYNTMRKFGIAALLIRLDDKLSRLISVTKNGNNEVTDESIEDTLKDLASYAIMGLEYLYNTPQP